MNKHFTQDSFYLATFLVLLFSLGIQRGIQEKISAVQYLDELTALLICPVLLYCFIKKEIPYTRKMILPLIALAVYWLSGWVGVFLYHYQPLSASLKDSYNGLKFFMTLGASFLFFQGICHWGQFYRKIWGFINLCTTALFVLTFLDLCFQIYYTETRWGLPAIKLFYFHYTDLSCVCILLACIYLRLYQYYNKKILPGLLMIAFILFNVKRIKAFGAILIVFLLYYFILEGRRLTKKLVIPFAIAMIGACGCILWQANYYLSVLKWESARYVLIRAGFWLSKMYFPFGTGWGTFGSAASGDPYSPVYTMYGMDQVWGLSESFHDFVSDTFWPMLAGQLGIFGFLAYALLILLLGVLIYRSCKKNHSLLTGAGMAYIYLLISSTSEAAFTGTLAVIYAFWIGFLLAEAHKSKAKHNTGGTHG